MRFSACIAPALGVAVIATLTSCSLGVNTEGSEPVDAHVEASRNGAGLPNAPQTKQEWAQHELNLAADAKAYGVSDAKPQKIVRWVPPEDTAESSAPCVVARGYARNDEGGFIDIPDGQKESFLRAMYECSTAYPAIPRYTFDFTEENITNIYTWLVNTNIPCVESLGHSVKNFPSQATYVSGFSSGMQLPLDGLPHLDAEQVRQIDAKCGQWPPSDVIYDGKRS